MLVNVYRARANDLHKTSECVDDRCEHVVFYNEHVAALNELSSKLDAALARDAMLYNHDCSNDGCAVPDGYTKEGAAFAQKYHDLKAERDDLASRLDEALKANSYFQERILTVGKERDEAWSRLDSIRGAIDGMERRGDCDADGAKLLLAILDGVVERHEPIVCAACGKATETGKMHECVA